MLNTPTHFFQIAAQGHPMATQKSGGGVALQSPKLPRHTNLMRPTKKTLPTHFFQIAAQGHPRATQKSGGGVALQLPKLPRHTNLMRPTKNRCPRTFFESRAFSPTLPRHTNLMRNRPRYHATLTCCGRRDSCVCGYQCGWYSNDQINVEPFPFRFAQPH